MIEKAETNCSAYVPDLPGCVTMGSTLEEVEREIRGAIAFHIDDIREDVLAISHLTSTVEYVELAT